MTLSDGRNSRMHSPRIIPSEKPQRNLQTIEAGTELESSLRPSGRETSNASSGSSIPQKILDVVIPV